jgi:hypothetical protein
VSVQLGPSANVCFEMGMLGHKVEEVRGVWRDWQDEERHNFYVSSNTY